MNGGGVKINGGWNIFKSLINGMAIKQGSHDTTGRACCGVQVLHARKCKVLAEHLLFLLWSVIHYRT